MPNSHGRVAYPTAVGRIVIHTHGRTRERGYAALIRTYADRLSGRGVRLESHSGRMSHDEYLGRIESNAEGGTLLLLDETGDAASTAWFADRWREWRLDSGSVHIAVGPVDGFEPDALERHQSMSLGPMTMTYEMAAVVLLEQLYRASEIERGSSYHRD